MERRIRTDFEATPDDADLNFRIWIFAEDLLRPAIERARIAFAR